MDEQTLRATVFAALSRIAPEVTPGEIGTASPLRDQVDLDSMDYLNFLIDLHTRLGVDIPESDYALLGSIDDIVRYLAARIGA
jgi:acyl carrier protein